MCLFSQFKLSAILSISFSYSVFICNRAAFTFSLYLSFIRPHIFFCSPFFLSLCLDPDPPPPLSLPLSVSHSLCHCRYLSVSLFPSRCVCMFALGFFLSNSVTLRLSHSLSLSVSLYLSVCLSLCLSLSLPMSLALSLISFHHICDLHLQNIVFYYFAANIFQGK